MLNLSKQQAVALGLHVRLSAMNFDGSFPVTSKLSVCLPAFSVFDAEHTKLWAVQVGDDIVNGSWVISDPVPGSWFCLKEGYGALYHPEGYALWALLDGTAVEGPRWHNQVRVLVSDISLWWYI